MQATRIAAKQGADEAVYVTPDGIVLEAPTSSIFWADRDGTPEDARARRRHPRLDHARRRHRRHRRHRGLLSPRRPARRRGGVPRLDDARDPADLGDRRDRAADRRRPRRRARQGGAARGDRRRALEGRRLGRRPPPPWISTLSDEQRLISETARRFADEVIAPRVRENDRAQRFDAELARRLGEMGYLGAPVAEEYGGRGLDYVSYALIVEQIGRADSAAADRRQRPDLARLRLDRALGHRGAEAPLAARPLLGRALRLLRPDRARLRLRRRLDAHPRRADRRRLADRRPEDVDLARQRRRRRDGLRPDRPGEEAPRPRLLPRPDRHRGLLLGGDPRQARPALLRHRLARLRRPRGARRRAARRGRRRLQDRDERARRAAATRSPPAASGSATAASRPPSPTRPSASSSASRSPASSSSRR